MVSVARGLMLNVFAEPNALLPPAPVLADDADDDDDDGCARPVANERSSADGCPTAYSTSHTSNEKALRTLSSPAASWLWYCGFQLTTLHGRQCCELSFASRVS